MLWVWKMCYVGSTKQNYSCTHENVFRQAQSAISGLRTFWEWSFSFHRQSESCSGLSHPTNVREIRAFLSVCSFSRRLVSSFAQSSKPPATLTRKGQKFESGPSQREAFEGMKDKICTTPVLAFPNFELPFILMTDTFNLAVAAVLYQAQDGLERPIAYSSRQMNRGDKHI